MVQWYSESTLLRSRMLPVQKGHQGNGFTPCHQRSAVLRPIMLGTAPPTGSWCTTIPAPPKIHVNLIYTYIISPDLQIIRLYCFLYHHHDHCCDMTLAVAEALSPNKQKLFMHKHLNIHVQCSPWDEKSCLHLSHKLYESEVCWVFSGKAEL